MIVNTASTNLERFRKDWGGEAMLHRLKACGNKMLVNWPVGVGKSVNCDALIEAAVRSGEYDLVIVLCPTWAIIDERRWAREPPPDVQIGSLSPRPREACGQLDAQWREFETRQMSHLAKETLCQHCPVRRNCAWPDQTGSNHLRRLDVLFATQTHLEIDPAFLERIPRVGDKNRTLVILDEDTFVKVSLRRSIRHDELCRFHQSLVSAQDNVPDWVGHEAILQFVDAMMMAKTADLCSFDWRMPRFNHEWALPVQQAGWDAFGEDYRFLGYDLRQFCHSPLGSRWRDEHKEIHFSFSPLIDHDTVLYSGTAEPAFVKYRLGVEMSNAFEEYEFKHPDTRWLNIASRIGAARNFQKNSDQILDFFAALTAVRIREGKRVLLVAKKKLVPLCVQGMQSRLRALGIADAQVVTAFDGVDLSCPSVVPIINYGVIGINLFEHFDAAYCLTSYYVDDKLLNESLQEMLSRDRHIGVEITTAPTRPRRRVARATRQEDEIYDTAQVAQLALTALEMDPVLQAVGRVRPYTNAREIITFQCSAFPRQPYDHEFDTLEEARQFYGIQAAREAGKQVTIQRVQHAKGEDLTQQETAQQLGLGLRTVQRYWHTP